MPNSNRRIARRAAPPAPPPAPIVVELTALEAQGYRLAGNAPDENVHMQIEIVLIAGGMDEPSALFMAQKLAEAGIEARQKIERARRFEVRVLEDAPDPPSVDGQRGSRR